jgi:hypothetical protein
MNEKYVPTNCNVINPSTSLIYVHTSKYHAKYQKISPCCYTKPREPEAEVQVFTVPEGTILAEKRLRR